MKTKKRIPVRDFMYGLRPVLSALLLMVVGNVVGQNPYLPLWEHLPDGEPRVFEDPDNPGRYRAYIIGSHDVTYTGYCGPDVRMWSAPVEDLTQWRDEGAIFTHFVDGQWDTMFAPDLVEVRDRVTGKKTYYLYPHSRGWRRVATVCKGDRPDGPFTPVNLTPDGRQCLPGWNTSTISPSGFCLFPITSGHFVILATAFCPFFAFANFFLLMNMSKGILSSSGTRKPKLLLF